LNRVIGNYGLESPLVYAPLLFLSPGSGLVCVGVMFRGIPEAGCVLEFGCEVGALEGRRKGMAVT
jgi:hypothetical protein